MDSIQLKIHVTGHLHSHINPFGTPNHYSSKIKYKNPNILYNSLTVKRSREGYLHTENLIFATDAIQLPLVLSQRHVIFNPVLL